MGIAAIKAYTRRIHGKMVKVQAYKRSYEDAEKERNGARNKSRNEARGKEIEALRSKIEKEQEEVDKEYSQKEKELRQWQPKHDDQRYKRVISARVKKKMDAHVAEVLRNVSPADFEKKKREYLNSDKGKTKAWDIYFEVKEEVAKRDKKKLDRAKANKKYEIGKRGETLESEINAKYAPLHKKIENSIQNFFHKKGVKYTKQELSDDKKPKRSKNLKSFADNAIGKFERGASRVSSYIDDKAYNIAVKAYGAREKIDRVTRENEAFNSRLKKSTARDVTSKIKKEVKSVAQPINDYFNELERNAYGSETSAQTKTTKRNSKGKWNKHKKVNGGLKSRKRK